MNSELCAAIENLQIIELRYNGYSRTVEPHAYGRDKSGDEILRCYQFSGGSDSGEREGWKLLKVREIYSLHPTRSEFPVRPNYKKGDKAMDFIFCQV
jgi:hypothetical protein